MRHSAELALREVLRLMRAGDWRGADQACRRLTAQFPEFPAAWFAASHIGTALKSPAEALEAIERAVLAEPADVSYLMRRAQCLLALHRQRDALEAANAVERLDPADPAVWDALGTLRSYANDQMRALAAYDRALALAPNQARFIYNRAAVRRFLGDLVGAEADYDRVIALKPSDYEAYLNRTELRVQTAARNHVTQLEALLRGGSRIGMGTFLFDLRSPRSTRISANMANRSNICKAARNNGAGICSTMCRSMSRPSIGSLAHSRPFQPSPTPDRAWRRRYSSSGYHAAARRWSSGY